VRPYIRLYIHGLFKGLVSNCDYTGCKCKVRTNFGHVLHIPKQETMSISTCARKHLTCELHRVDTSINVWAGIVGDCLVGPNVLPHRLTGNHYRDELPELLEDVPLAVRARMWYMHDGAPAHFSRAVRDVLNIMIDGYAEEDPLHGLHAHRI
jgi:hypothetical protein